MYPGMGAIVGYCDCLLILMFSGISNRLTKELTHLAPTSMKVFLNTTRHNAISSLFL